MAKRLSTRSLVRGGVAVTALFVIIALYAGVTFWRARRAAVESSANALPSIRYLTAARTDLRRMGAAMDEALIAVVQGEPIQKAALVELRHVFDVHLDAFRALPLYAGQAPSVEHMLEALQRFDATKDHLFALFDGADWSAIHQYENSAWSVANERLDDALQTLIDSTATVLAERLVHLEHISTTSIVVLSVASFLGLVVALLAIRIATRSIRLYEESLEARAAEWEIFSARLAHDLMSPLQVVGIALSVAGERVRDERDVRLTSRALAALKRVRDITDALLNFARAGGSATPGEHASVPDVATALHDEMRPAAEENDVELVFDAIAPCEVGCSAGMLNVILSNLLRNAIKHMGERPVRRVTLHAEPIDHRVRIEVRDTGPGLDPGAEHQVFRPFVRRTGGDVAGIGLGLATVKRTVEAYGGDVGVRSTKGVGSTFWVELPLPA